MRYKQEHKEITHARIVDAAAREFRTQGFDGLGIASLMAALNLTHGGFYAHFENKEDLIAEAMQAALRQSTDTMIAALKAGGVAAFLAYYLSEGHRDHPELGCPVPPLAAEVARRYSATREAFDQELSRGFDALAEYMPGANPDQRRRNAYALFAGMVGGVALARAISDTSVSTEVLDATRRQLLAQYGDNEG
jgi:TetR/AcrR family transcriptional repressor of nem operon